jgi:chromosome segregation ATPase
MAIDENGNVTNYIEVMDALLENYEYLANGGDDGLINDAERIAMEALEADIQELQEYIDAYCDAVETAEDIQNEIEDSAEGGYIDISNLDDTIDKLHDINNTLDEIQEALDDSSKAADRLYGSARIAQMQKTASLLQKEISALEKKAELQKDIIADEQAELNMKASAMSTTFTFDDRGNVTNYRAVMEAERAEIEAKKAELEADGNFTTDD